MMQCVEILKHINTLRLPELVFDLASLPCPLSVYDS